MLALMRVSCVVWAIGVWGWIRDVCLMCNGPDRSNPPSTSARGGPGGRARGGNGCEGGDGCLRAVLQSLLAAPAGLLALLSLPNMFFSRFTTCLRAAKSARRARWASRPSLAAEHVFLSLHYLSSRCCHASHALQAPSPPSAWPRKAEPVLLRQPPGPAVASLGLSMLRPCLPFPPSAWLAEGRASASCASRPALAAASLGSSTLRPCRRHPFQTFRDLPGFVSVLSVHPSGPPSIITRAMDCMLLLPCNGLRAALTPNPPTVGGPPRGLKHQEGLVIPSSPRDKG